MLEKRVVKVEIRIDAARQAVFITAEGKVTEAGITDAIARLRAEPNFRPHFSELLDMRGVTGFEVSSEAVRALTQLDLFDPSARRAFVVASDLAFGLARMYSLARGPHEQLRVFRSVEEARAWLGLPEEG